MKRFLAVILVVLLLNPIVLTASAGETDETVYKLEDVMYDEDFRTYSSGLSAFSETLENTVTLHEYGYYYTHISERFSRGVAKEVYDYAVEGFDISDGVWSVTFKTDTLNGQVYNSDEFTEMWSVIKNEAMCGMWCYRYDNPLFADRFTNSVKIKGGFSIYSSSNTVATTAITLTLTEHSNFRESYITRRDKKIEEIAAEANRKPSIYHSLKYIYETIIKMTDYDYVGENYSSSTRTFFLDHSALGILVGHSKTENGVTVYERKAVCEGYAKAFMEVVQSLDNAPEIALLTSEGHMWNIVLLEGKWYCIDPTWDDGGGLVVYDKYFLCGDPDIVDEDETAHQPDGEYTIAPVYAEGYYVFNPIDGDITFDGEINVIDLIRFKRIISDALDKEFYDNADLDNSTIVDTLDMVLLKKILIQ